jgi:hypothetical protein
MRVLRSRTMRSEKAQPSPGRGLLESTRVSSGTAPSDSRPDSDRPEWATERWKLQVEAEARGRLKRLIRGVRSDG